MNGIYFDVSEVGSRMDRAIKTKLTSPQEAIRMTNELNKLMEIKLKKHGTEVTGWWKEGDIPINHVMIFGPDSQNRAPTHKAILLDIKPIYEIGNKEPIECDHTFSIDVFIDGTTKPAAIQYQKDHCPECRKDLNNAEG